MKSLHENICRPKHNPAQFSCTASFPKLSLGSTCSLELIANTVPLWIQLLKIAIMGFSGGLISRYLPPKHLIIAIWIKIKMAAVLTKRSPLNNIICSFRKAFGPQFFPKETSNPNKELYYQQKILVITN